MKIQITLEDITQKELSKFAKTLAHEFRDHIKEVSFVVFNDIQTEKRNYVLEVLQKTFGEGKINVGKMAYMRLRK